MENIERIKDPVEVLTYSRKTGAIAMGLSERKFDQVVIEFGVPSFVLGRCRRYRKKDLQEAIDRIFEEQHSGEQYAA
ncbi:MAG: hypothetical protein ABFD54_04335 [Armatimonadota bacterium]